MSVSYPPYTRAIYTGRYGACMRCDHTADLYPYSHVVWLCSLCSLSFQWMRMAEISREVEEMQQKGRLLK